MSLTLAQKYYNVARSICRACAAEHVSVRNAVLTISKEDYEALKSMVGEYPTIKYADEKLSIFNVDIKCE